MRKLGTMESLGQRALAQSRGATRGHDEQEVVALLGQTEAGQRLTHHRLRLGEGAAELGDQLDVGQSVTRPAHTLSGHALNVHAGGLRRLNSRAPALGLESCHAGRRGGRR